MFFYDTFYWAALKGNAQSRITFHLCQKGKTWRTQLSAFRRTDLEADLKRPQNPLLGGVIGAISLPNDFLNTVFG